MDEGVTLCPIAFGGYVPVTTLSPSILLATTLPVLSIRSPGVRVKSGVTSTEAGVIVISLSFIPLIGFFLNVTVHVGADGMLNFTSSPVTLFSSRSKPSSLSALYHAPLLP